jgi:hypothetical protein
LDLPRPPVAEYIGLKRIDERRKCGHGDAWAGAVSRPVVEVFARIYGFTVMPDARALVSGVGAGGARFIGGVPAECIAVRIV